MQRFQARTTEKKMRAKHNGLVSFRQSHNSEQASSFSSFSKCLTS